MALDIVRNINVDFHDTKYIIINAKQYDDSSRYIAITCYSQGVVYNLNSNEHSAYVKFKKADGNAVLNFCKINDNGEVLVELTEQMLAAVGMCEVELVIINKGKAMVNIDTGDIIAIDDTPILSTMAFCVNVYETTVDVSDFESSYEFNALIDLMQRAEADYTEVVRLSKSYAVGDAGEIRDGEDADNAKYYCEQAGISADSAKKDAQSAASSSANANNSAQNASTYAQSAASSASSASSAASSARSANNSAQSANNSAQSAATRAQSASTIAENASQVAQSASTIAENKAASAIASANAAKTSEENAAASETNAAEYCEVVKAVANGLNSGFIPIGTITFAELATAEKATGFTYNISDDFVTDNSFAEGEGKQYTAGVNVYCRSDGLWDCFGGTASPTATVDEVREYLGI